MAPLPTLRARMLRGSCYVFSGNTRERSKGRYWDPWQRLLGPCVYKANPMHGMDEPARSQQLILPGKFYEPGRNAVQPRQENCSLLLPSHTIIRHHPYGS